MNTIKLRNNEKGFTLIEVIIVIAILAVFIVIMTSLLIIPTKMSQAIIYEKEGYNAFSLLQTHLNQSIRKNATEGAVNVDDIPSYGKVLSIKVYTEIPTATTNYLYYFYKHQEKSVYVEYGASFSGNIDKSMLIAEQVERLNFEVVDKDLSIIMDVLIDNEDKTKKETKTTKIFLKAN